MYKGKWSSDSTSVTPVWNKEDGERVSGHMIVESNDEKVYHNICLAVENILKGELDVAGVFQASHDNESDFYAQITKPDVDYLRKTGCPESWIPLIMEDWRKKVEAHRNGEK